MTFRKSILYLLVEITLKNISIMINEVNITVSESKETISAHYNGTQVGNVILQVGEPEEGERHEGNKFFLIESADVEAEYRGNGIYTAMIKKFIECLEDNEFLLSWGRSEDAYYFWTKKFDVDIINEEKEEQTEVIVVDNEEFIQIWEHDEIENIDFM